MYDREYIAEISKLLFELLVANDSVLSLQMPDGNYIPQVVSYDYSLFQKMIEQNESIGVYQQKRYSDLIKWICLDFDCKKQGNGNVKSLYNQYVNKVCERLDNFNLNYLLEFSGRRGIHIWIVFDSFIKKNEAYQLEMKILEEISSKIKDDLDYGIDLFPATRCGRNKYGKAVKLPLSTHKKGGQSFFFRKGEDFLNNEIIYEEQYDILSKYRMNSLKSLFEILGKSDVKRYTLIYKKEYAVNKSSKFSLNEIFDKCNGSKVLNSIFENVKNSNMSYYDKLIMCSTFGNFSDENLIYDIFKLQDNYDASLTNYYVTKLRKQLFPITMGYLYDTYNENLEEDIEPNQTVLEYICKNVGIDIAYLPKNKLNSSQFIKELSTKEFNYFLYNDEVINIRDYFDLKNMSNYECQNISMQIDSIVEGNVDLLNKNHSFNIYVRHEEDKNRILVSLNPHDRVLTTALIFKFIQLLKWDFNSFSYKLNYYNYGGVFFPWFDSWKRFERSVELYLSFDVFNDYGLIKVDIKNFYDNIYFHSIYSQMKEAISKNSSLDEKNQMNHILTFLTKFNENLMLKINDTIKGVPQGPVYARVLAELFISTIILEFQKKFSNYSNYSIFRYVDDIFIIYHGLDGEKFLNNFKYHLNQHGLKINFDKTKYFPRIGNMTNIEKSELFENSKWNYSIQNIKNLKLEDDYIFEEKLKLFNSYLNRNQCWNINDANFILGGYIDEVLVKKYISRYIKSLVTSEIGRGSIFIKLYNVIFDDYTLLVNFFINKMYLEIPKKTLNFKNFINALYFNEKKLKNYVGNENLNALMCYLLSLSDLDDEDKSTIQSLNLIGV